MKWTDTREIAIELAEKFPEVDPRYVNFPNLYQWTCELDQFDDDPKNCGEKILESIQQHWIDEM